MRNITNNSILSLKEVVAGQLIIPNQDGFIFGEAGNPLEIDNDIVLLYTMGKADHSEQWLYYSYCNKNDITNWKHMGRLKVSGMTEDPYLLLKSGKFILKAENRNKPDKYTICQYHSTDWDYKTNTGTWQSDGTIYEHPGGGMYSPLFGFEGGKEFNFAEERYGSKYKDINIVDADTRKILLHYDDDWNILVSDYIYKINNKYVQFGHGLYHKGKSDQGWHHFIAQSNKLLSGWKITSKPISPMGIIPVLLDDNWNYLVEGNGGLFLGESKTTKPPNGGDMEAPKNVKVENKILTFNYTGPKVKVFDICGTLVNNIDWLGHALPNERSFDTTGSYKGVGQEFWLFGIFDDNSKTPKSNVFKIEADVPIPDPKPPSDNDEIKKAIRVLNKNYNTQLNSLLEKIE